MGAPLLVSPPEVPATVGRYLGLASCGLCAEMVKKALKAVVSCRRINGGRLLSAPTVCDPIAIPANLIDFLDEIGIEVLVRFQHFEETAVLDALSHLVEGTLDGHLT